MALTSLKFTAALAALALGACASTGASKPAESSSAPARALPAGLDPAANPNPFPSTYQPLPSRPTAIVGATVLTATGQEIAGGTVIRRDGKIEAVGPGLAAPAGYDVVDGRGKWVTPGVIDAHSHLGVYPSPSVPSRQDGNEMTNPNTAQVWVEHSLWPLDPGFDAARAAGVTSLQILPGSGNLFGGRSVTVKNVPAVTAQGMKFPGAPYGLKMACGENPKREYGRRNQTPASAMANVFGYRRAWIDAADYTRKWDDYRAKKDRGEKADPPKRDLQLDTLMGVLKGDILVQNHCYRGDEMALMIDVAKEFGYRITAFHHAVEAYKVADILAREDICTATWSAWTGFKMEGLDGIEYNAPLVWNSGACIVIHSDDAILIQRLNQETAAAVAAGKRLGIDIPKAEAVKWFTINAAKMMGVADRTGSLEPGKMADVVLWSADPFSVYAKADKVYIDGALTYDRADPRTHAKSDFLLGRTPEAR
ncbi:MAG TPA: amidohydrolase [Phenylobacterium sp.]|nr:amidohydrolase [Phenylobacterium sp.]